jgi:hypothetical protein
MKKIFWLSLFFPIFVMAQKSLVERVYEGQSNQKNPVAARQEITAQGTEKVSADLIKEIIGEAKYNRNKAMIQSKIIKNSARYVPFSKPGEIEPLTPEGFKMNVTLKVSVEDLQALLLENGLFYESDSTPIVLPAVRIKDRVNSKTFAWWTDPQAGQKAFLFKEGRGLEENLKSAFLKHNFYLLKPENFRFAEVLPESLKGESIRLDEWQLIAQKFGAQILVDGELVISKSQERSDANTIALRMTATQVMNGRVIAEVSRQFETDPGPFEQVVDRKLKEVLESTSQDLASQVLDAWQKGSLGASLYRLTIRGRLPLQQQEAFKEALKSKVREVKNVRERLISSDQLVFEVDSALGPKELAQKANEIDFAGLKIVLESASDKEAVYRVAR